ncbi:kynureninase [Candidatus Bathyarchaeota archaeon]|nr:MAG: kynureninase [Candidatus Bathyarchaeota archaeon]
MDTSRSYAEKLDKQDPLAKWRKEFYIPEREILGLDGKKSVKPIHYFEGNSLGLMSTYAEKGIQNEINLWKTLTSRNSDVGDQTREYQAKLVGADPDEVIMAAGATINIHVLISTFYQPEGKRTKVLADELNFPSDLYALWGQIRLKGEDPDENLVLVKSRDGKTIEEDDIIAAMDDTVSVCFLPSVYFTSGQLLDIERLTKAAHEHGIKIGFDCCHSIGIVPHYFDKWGVDFALWCNYKYMNGGSGAIAGLYVNKRHFGTMPGMPGWWGNSWSNRFDFETNFKPAENAEAWFVGNPSNFAQAPVYGSSKMVDEAGIENIRKKSLKITQYLMDLVDAELTGEPYNYTVGNPRAPERRGGHVALMHPEGQRLNLALSNRGVLADFRPPTTIRLTPVPLYTSYVEVWECVQHLKQAIDNREYENYSKDQHQYV